MIFPITKLCDCHSFLYSSISRDLTWAFPLIAWQKKCEQYWPDEEEGCRQYGPISVQLLDTDELPDFTIRTFLLTKVSIGSSFHQPGHFYLDDRLLTLPKMQSELSGESVGVSRRIYSMNSNTRETDDVFLLPTVGEGSIELLCKCAIPADMLSQM